MKEFKILKYGHRGAKAYVAENTISSILKAIALGVDGIEIDVHKCKSGELVVFHDFTLDRLTNRTGEISNFTLKELKTIKVLEHYNIPTLTEVLDAISKSKPCKINIELKGNNTAETTVNTIESYIKDKQWEYKDFIVSSFNFKALTTVFNSNKNIPLGVLTASNLDKAVTFAKTINAVAIHPDFNLLTRKKVESIQILGYQINTWTVNKLKDIKRIKSFKVNAIISDFPDRL